MWVSLGLGLGLLSMIKHKSYRNHVNKNTHMHPLKVHGKSVAYLLTRVGSEKKEKEKTFQFTGGWLKIEPKFREKSREQLTLGQQRLHQSIPKTIRHWAFNRKITKTRNNIRQKMEMNQPV